MLQKALALAVSISMLFPICTPAAAAQEKPPTLSLAVTTAAQTALTNLNNKLKKRTETAADVREAVTASSILFAHMQETGYNAWLTGYLLAHRQDVEQKAKDLSTIDRFYSDLANPKIGMAGIEARFVSGLSLLETSDVVKASYRLAAMPQSNVCVQLAADLAVVEALAYTTPPPFDAYLEALAAMYAVELAVLSAAGMCR